MKKLTVGSNVPIKLKVSVETESVPVSYGFLYNSDDELPYSIIPAFDPKIKTGWKSLDKGNRVDGKLFIVLTFFRFMNSFPNEKAFTLAIDQIKDTYKVQISGGTPSPFEAQFSTESFYDSRTCIIESKVKLI